MDMYRILENFDAVNSKQTLTEGSMKRHLEDRAEHMSKEDFVASAGEYGMSTKEAAAFWIAVNGEDEELDEAEIWPAREGEKVSANGKPAVIVGQIPTPAGSAKYYAVKFDGKQYPGNTYDQVHANQISAAGVAEGDMEEGNAFSGAVAKAKADGVQPGEKVTVGGKTYPVKEVTDAELDAQALAQRKRQMATAKNSRAVQSQSAGAAKRSDIPAAVRKARGDAPLSKDELSEVFPGTPEYELRFGKDDASSAFDKKKISTGTVYSRRYRDEPESDDDAPKAAGRPKGTGKKLGAKGPSVASKLLKGKGGLKEHDIDIQDRGEYDREGDMALNQVHQIADAARELHAILASDDNLPEWVQSKITKALDYIDTARDYLGAEGEMDREESLPEADYSAKSARAGKDIGKPGKAFAKIAKDAGERYGSKERGEKVAGAVLAKLRAKEGVEEVAPPGAKAERMVKHIKKGYADDGKLTDREKAIAYATAWKAKKAGKVEEESTETKDQHAEKAGKKVAKDIEHDEGHKGKDDAKAEKAGKKVTKDIEYDDKKDKEEKVDETTVSGSVATAPAGGAPKSKGGMQFGKGVYEGQVAESFEAKLRNVLNEGMSVNVSTDDTGKKSISVNATDADADALGNMLKMAGLFSSEGYSRTCESCHGIHEAGACGADMVEEGDLANSPDEVYADKDYMLQQLSGGLNGPKTTGQTTGPVVNRQDSRQGVMAEAERVKEQAESRLWNLYKKI